MASSRLPTLLLWKCSGTGIYHTNAMAGPRKSRHKASQQIEGEGITLAANLGSLWPQMSYSQKGSLWPQKGSFWPQNEITLAANHALGVGGITLAANFESLWPQNEESSRIERFRLSKLKVSLPSVWLLQIF